MLDVLIIIVIY